MNQEYGRPDELPGLGLCCYCRERDASVVWFTAYKVPPKGRGKGWRCVVCDLPRDGAVAVYCPECTQTLEAGGPEAQAWLTQPVVCIGYAWENRRKRLTQPEPFGHDMSRHPEMEEER